jgi:hypothetical protein
VTKVVVTSKVKAVGKLKIGVAALGATWSRIKPLDVVMPVILKA